MTQLFRTGKGLTFLGLKSIEKTQFDQGTLNQTFNFVVPLNRNAATSHRQSASFAQFALIVFSLGKAAVSPNRVVRELNLRLRVPGSNPEVDKWPTECESISRFEIKCTWNVRIMHGAHISSPVLPFHIFLFFSFLFISFAFHLLSTFALPSPAHARGSPRPNICLKPNRAGERITAAVDKTEWTGNWLLHALEEWVVLKGRRRDGNGGEEGEEEKEGEEGGRGGGG